MRKRSFTLSAPTIEDYQKSATNSSVQYISSSPSDQKYVLVLKESSNTYCNAPSPSCEQKKVKKVAQPTKKARSVNDENCWADFDYKLSEDKENYSYALRKKRFQAVNAQEDDSDPASDTSKTIINKNVMLIGCRGTGKHTFVRSLFGEQNKEDIPLPNQIMDLMIKTEEKDDIKTNYHLWLRTLDDHRFDNIVRVYHKKVKVFVFVYSVNEERTFKALDEAMQSVLRDVPREKFVGILVGNKTTPGDMESERQVSFDEGLALKEKYNLKLFLEANYNDECLKEKVLSVL